MAMSTHVNGIKPPNDKWREMKAVYDACQAAGIAIPKDVSNYFGHSQPDEKGVLLSQRELGDAVTEWDTEMQNGYEVDIAKLPKDVVIIRFVNSY